MLSILIPTYNHACTPLVSELLRQSEGLDVEIIVAEDGTGDATSLASNKWIAQMPHCRYLPLKDNHGRAGIRNLLAKEAKGERLLFLDDDVMPAHGEFVLRYFGSTASVVCGGVLAAKDKHTDNLRWRYDKAAESGVLSLSNRKDNPYRCFTTQNFMVKRDVFMSILFDESIKDYGYEDALFGRELQRRTIGIEHIDNPVHHNGLDSNADFLHKAEQALVTLSRLPQMQPHASVSRMAKRVRFLAPLLRLACPILRPNLLSRHPFVLALQLYKLGFYMKVMPKNV